MPGESEGAQRQCTIRETGDPVVAAKRRDTTSHIHARLVQVPVAERPDRAENALFIGSNLCGVGQRSTLLGGRRT